MLATPTPWLWIGLQCLPLRIVSHIPNWTQNAFALTLKSMLFSKCHFFSFLNCYTFTHLCNLSLHLYNWYWKHCTPLYVILFFYFLFLTKSANALRWTYNLHIQQLYKCLAYYLFETGIVSLYNVQIEGASVHKLRSLPGKLRIIW